MDLFVEPTSRDVKLRVKLESMSRVEIVTFVIKQRRTRFTSGKGRVPFVCEGSSHHV